MSKNVQAESNVRQACLNGIAEAQPLFCKEHFISCFVFCSFVLPHNADEVGAFMEVERINHVGAAVPPKGPPGLTLQMSTQRFSLVFSMGSSTKSGHSHTPPCAPCLAPKLLSCFHSFRLAEEKICISCPTANIMTQCLPGHTRKPSGRGSPVWWKSVQGCRRIW